MRAFTMRPADAGRWPRTGLLYLAISGLLWGTGGLTGSLLGRTAGLSAISVAAFRLTAGGVRSSSSSPRPAGAGREPGGLDPDHHGRPAGRDLPELLLRRRGADLGTAGHPGHHRRRSDHRARRRPGDRTAGWPVRGRHHGPGRDGPRPAGGPAVRFPRDGRAGQRGHGRARRGGLRRGHHGRLPAGARTGRPHRDRIRLHHRRTGPDGAGPGRRWHRLQAAARPSAC